MRRRQIPGFSFVIPAAFVDVLTVSLLWSNFHRQQHFDHLPVVEHEQNAPSEPPHVNPLIVEVKVDGELRVSGEDLSWDEVDAKFASLNSDQSVFARVVCNDDGQGKVASLLRLSLLAQRHGLADRLLIITRDTDPGANAP